MEELIRWFRDTTLQDVPLVGGKIESYLGGQFAEHIPEIQRFTTAWIRERD